MGPPPGGTGPAMAPEGMAGAGAHAQDKVKTGLEMLQQALPGLEMGSELHAAVLKAITQISTHVAKGVDDASGKMQQLVTAARAAQSGGGPTPTPMMAGGGGAPPPPAPM